jgi:hypothetical protein
MSNKVIKALVSGPSLIIQAVLIGAVSWPMANHNIAYFWWSIGAFVGLWELVNKFFLSPKRQTISNDIRDESVAKEWWRRGLFWVMITLWLVFAVTLAAHFMTRLF